MQGTSVSPLPPSLPPSPSCRPRQARHPEYHTSLLPKEPFFPTSHIPPSLPPSLSSLPSSLSPPVSTLHNHGQHELIVDDVRAVSDGVNVLLEEEGREGGREGGSVKQHWVSKEGREGGREGGRKG